MQLLLEEFFKKVHKLSKGKTSITLLILVRLIFYLLAIGVIGLFIYLILAKNYFIIIILACLVLLGELAHYIRKSREKDIASEKKKHEKENARNVLNPIKAKNKGLLKNRKVKNKTLLEKSKPKNRNLLKKNT